MDNSPRKPCKRIPEPIDEWLHTEGYFRKHAPRDPTCLFRAISEQVYLTQHFHLKVRHECVKFMRDNKELFEESISIPFESYLEQMSYFTEWGGLLEIKAMSLLYQRDIVMFNGQKLTRQLATNNGFEKIIYLCHIPPKQYETVYERDFITTAAFCQSIVYQTLYKDVFEMSDVDDTVFKMLHDRSNNVSHEKFFLKENLPFRDQLTVELFNKLEKNQEETEEPQTGIKNMTPFPYRIAKALDPDIYRNTDFDIWHEIRREIRNAGWMKYNSSDLQVGGKCLVHMDTKEDELDNTINNFTGSIHPGEKSMKDNNGNEPKSLKKSVKRDPLIYSGHIQEMSKDEGPVVVFIEELGEKKTVPYSSLKPINQKKNKQSNWPVINHKKNTIFDSGNQRWKKSNWYGSSRKIKDLAINLNSLTSTQIDKNNNKVHSQDMNQWDNESGHSDESSLSYKTYAMERLTAYQGYAVNTSIDVMPVSVVLDSPHPTVIESLQFDASKPDESNTSNPANSSEKPKMASDTVEKQVATTSTSTVTPEMIPHPSQNCNRNAQNEIYYPTQTGITPYLAGNGSVYFPATDCNIVPSAQYFIDNGTSYSAPSMDSLHPANQGNQALQSVNTSAPPSVEANYSDLPLSDLPTLKFFYNLGVEYFRANCSLMGCGSGQAMPFGTYYIPPGTAIQNQYNNPTAINSAVNEVLTLNEEISHINENFQQKLVVSQQQGEQICSNREFSPNNGKGHGRTLSTNNHGSQRPMNRNDSPNLPENKSSSQHSTTYSPNSEKMKESPPSNKDNQRTNRNTLAPRFKKNFDGRYRNSRQQQHQHQQQQQQQQQHQQQQQQQHHPQHQQPQQNQQQQQTFQHQQNLGNIETQTIKNIGAQNPHCSEGQPMPLHNLAPNTGNNPVYQNHMSQVPYSQPPMYAAVPYYQTETEPTFQNPYYPSNQSFSVPYIPHADITDGNNVSHYPPNIYQGGETFGQPYPLYPQYMYPPGLYPTMSPQNTPENWYPLPGQSPTMPVPHYVQYSPTPTSLPNSPNGPQSSNVSK